MRSGGRVQVSLNTKNLLPTPADADPATVRLKQKLPDGSEVEVLPAWPTIGSPIIKDSIGDWHYDTDPLVTPLVEPGEHRFVWKPADGFPEATVSVVVEESEW